MKFKGRRLVELSDKWIVHWWQNGKHYYKSAPEPQADGGDLG